MRGSRSEIDEIDQRIIDALMRDGRKTITDLSVQVGLSKTPCAARVRRMEQVGIIRGYAAYVDAAKLGRDHIAFVQVSLTDTKAAALDAFSVAVRAVPEIEQCHMIAGAFDFLLKVRTEDIAEYRRVLAETISALPFVSHTSTFVAMETVKDEPVAFSGRR